jgi:hypothetical protein
MVLCLRWYVAIKETIEKKARSYKFAKVESGTTCLYLIEGKSLDTIFFPRAAVVGQT